VALQLHALRVQGLAQAHGLLPQSGQGGLELGLCVCVVC
jgi:hypothetical protein